MASRLFSIARSFLASIALASGLGTISSVTNAQTIDEAFVNVFDLVGGARGSYVTGFPYSVPLAVANVSGSSVSLAPNTELYESNPGDSFWRDNGGAGPGGNKWVEISVFENTFYPASGNEFTQTFTGCASSNTLVPPYSSVAFIRVFDGGFNLIAETTANANGTFDLGIPVDNTTIDVNVQVGFQTSGPNANPDDLPLGSVDISIGAPCATAPPGSGPGKVGHTIPVLPIWALIMLAGIMGLFGVRAASKRGE